MKYCPDCGVERNPVKRGNLGRCPPCSAAHKVTLRNKWKKGKAARERLKEVRRWNRRQLKLEVISAYGGACACCGESNEAFLAIDHINDDGCLDRQTRKDSIYARLRREGFPTDRYQLLCFNCNWAKAHGGCPHKFLTAQPLRARQTHNC